MKCSRTGRSFKWCPSCYVDHNLQAKKAWAAANPERARIIGRNAAKRRRARLRSCVIEVFTDIEIYERDSWRCQLCNKKVGRRFAWPHPLSASLDHLIPLALGGNHVRSNVVLAHLTCNLKKNVNPVGEQLLLIG